MDKFNEQNVCFNIKKELEESYQSIISNNFKCYTCKKSYSNIEDFSKHLISIQHEESINYKIGVIKLNIQIRELIEKDEHEKRMNDHEKIMNEHEKIMNRLNQKLLEINKKSDKLREERQERVRIEKEKINEFLSLFCLKIV
jgi:hypothetical protein